MNKVYKTIWNNSLGAWVVTSELGRGKIKSATSKALAGIALTTLLSTQAIATPCDPGTLTCDLGSTWGAAANNNQNGTAVISDGNSYAISGVSSWGAGQSTYLALRDIQTIIDRGYAVYQGGVAVTTVPKADRMIVSPGLTESILVFDPITSSNTSVLVYHSASFTDKDTYDLGASGAFMRQGATPYVDTRLANISHGVANISLDNDSYAIGEMRESSFVYVDGTTANHAQANWDSQQLLSVMSPADWSKSSSLTNFNAVKDTFVGSLAAFDGSQHTITSLDSYKAYNDWLISQLKTGDLRYSQYQTELNKAYNRVTTVYQYSNLPEGSSPSSYGENYAYWLHAKGENATVTVASGGKLNVSVGSSTTFNTVRLEDKAIGINNGEILSTANLAYILSGGRFTNNGLMSLGGGVVIGAYGAAPVIVSGTGSSFINNTGGVYNVSPRHYYTNKGSNGAVFGVSVYAGGSAENKGTINAGYWQDNIPEQVTGLVYVARAYTNSSFVNAESGQINLGYAQDGINLAYLSSGSAGIVSDIGARGENQGTITLSSMADGVYGMYGLNGTTSLLNNGTINVNSNGDDGRFVPSQSIGIYSISQTLGTVNNTNTINLNGLNNIGIKAFAGGKATSSGTINVAGGIDATTGLRNYGVWSETINSLVDISGSVNLKGDGAIGVHARSGGTISLSGNGQVNFSDGENQIGYFVYGAGSKINNTSSGAQDVTTKNSTLMRLDGGATFAGSSGATSTMSASGDNANVIVATGTGTRVDSGGMTVNVNGKNATGFLIEGGATGNIGNTATIKLSGEGAIAGIADGQGHDLTGAEKIMTEAEKKATSLTAGANLNSSLNGVVGYIARNLATLTNSGSITFSGDNTTGIQVEEGAVGVNSGNITLDGQGSVGLKASASTLETKLSSTGNLTLNGNWNGADDATRTTGVLADGSQVSVTIGDGINAAAVNLNGAGTVGVHATAGSTVTLNDNVAVNFNSNNSDQIAFWVDGNGSQIITDAGTTETQVNGDGATLFYVTDTATLGGALNLKLSGKAGSDKITSGIRVSGAGSLATLATGSQLTIGTNATGVLAENAGKAVIENGAAFNISGDKAIVGKASGEHSLVENKATVTSGDGSSGSTAFLAENGGEIDNQGTINLSLGADHTAISLNNGHLVNSGNIQANGTAIHIKGSDSTITNAKTIEAVNGKAAIHVDAGAGLNLSAASGTGTIKAGGTADGILLSEGALSLNVANTVIEMSDAGASGIGIHNVAGIEGIKLDNTKIQLGGTGIGIKTGASLAKTNSGNINVTDGTGILYLNEDGSAVASDIDFSDSKKLVIDVSGQGVGVKATLDGNNRTVNTGVSVNVESLSGGSAIDVSGAKTVANTGELVSKSTVANGNVLNVHDAETISNSGTITASSADIAAIAMSNAGNKTFTNTGTIKGLLDFATGDNLINLTGGTLTGNIKASSGSNTLTASDGSVHTGEIILAGTQAQTVTVNDASTLGNLVMAGAGNHQITVTEASALGNVALGDGNSQITVDGSTAGNITLGTGNNNLTLSGSAQIANLVAGVGGNNTVLVKDTATFGTLDAGTGGANDSLTFDGVDYQLANTSDIQHFDLLNLTHGADFTTAQQIQMGDTATSSGRIDIDGASSLVLNATGDYRLNHALSGNGLVDITAADSFDFGPASGSQFAGSVQMNSKAFNLSDDNTKALTNATLKVMSDNTTTVGNGNQLIGGLSFNGGTVDFGVSIPNASVAANHIQATTLDASATGSVQIARGVFDNATPPVNNQTLGLLDQQTETLVELVSAVSVTGAAGNLVLKDENGAVISHATTADILQNGTHAANARYDYRLTTTNNTRSANGLYVGYGLTELELLTAGTDELVINTAHSVENVLSAKVTGAGDLGITAGNGTDALVLSNLNNDYTGVTDLKSGTVRLGTDNGFGASAKLSLANATTADINGKTQTIGALEGKFGSTLNLNGGDLTLTNGGSTSGTLTGSGDLTVAGGTLTVTHANANLSASTTVNVGAEALLEDVLALGTGNMMANGELTLSDASGTLTNAVSGSGQLNSHNGSDVTLSGNNSGFSGVMEIDATSSFTVSETQHLGATTEVKNANQFIANNSAAMTLAAVVSGAGELVKHNTGTLTLSGTNTYRGNTDIQGGTVAISADANLGDMANQTLLNGGNLQITADLTSARDVTLVKDGSVMVDSGVTATLNGWDDQTGGTGTVTKAGDGTLIWSGDNSGNTANVSVTGGTLQVESLNNLASNNGEVHLGANGTLSILKNAADDVDFTRQLSGSGELLANLGSKTQALTMNASSAGGHFTGQVTMDNGRFVLNSNADNTLAQATLQLNANGSTQLVGNHAIGGLTMNGGQLEVEFSSVNNRPEGLLTVSTLDVVGGGNLAITTPGNLPNPIPVTGASLFDQDDGVFDAVVKAIDSVNGVGTQIAVTKLDGTPVVPDTIVGLIQSGTTAGNAHYNYFGAVKQDGLYLGFGLTQIDAFAGQSVILDNANAIDNGLGAKLTGDGGFTINANGTVRIGNASSDYTGATDLNSGSVVMITHHALGQTGLLNMQSHTGLDLNGNRQTLGSLAAMADSVINLNGGELTISNGGQTDGTFTGQGKLILSGDTLTLNQNSSHFTGTTEIESGATARLTKPQGLGQGIINIHSAGTLNLDSAKGTLFNSLNGSGDTLLTQGADMYLGGNNAGYSGTFTTETGTTLTATEKNQLGTATISNSGTFAIDTTGLWTLDNSVSGSGTVVKQGTGTVQLESDNVSAGLTRIENGLLLIGGEQGSASLANLTGNVTIGEDGALGGYGSVTGNVTNRGNLIMGHALTGGGHGQFTIDGDYTGDNGTLIFNTTLDGDSSSTDMLRITGDTDGKSKVMVMSARGDGAQTSDGIKLIDVQGSSKGQFSLSGRAIAGAYEYFLYQGGIATPTDGDWYLRSSLSSLNPDPSVYRPEAGGYMANMAAAGNLFSLRLSDREGRAENSSLWLRQEGSRNKHRDSTGQLRTATNSYVVQGGGEVLATQFSDTDRFGLGIMMAYGQADSKVHSQKTGYKANSSIDGYSTGVYGTWYQDAKTLNGAYVDSWVQYSWLDAEVNGQDVAKETYDMDGFSASIEAGYRLPVYQGLNGDVFITPQGQISWNGITADDHREAGGTRVSSSGHDNVQTRLGVKVSRDGVSDKDKGTDKLFTVYAEANWLHNSQQAGAVLDGTEVKQSGSRNVGELKLGAEGQLNSHLNLWTNVAQQMGDNGYSDTAVTLGVKYRF